MRQRIGGQLDSAQSRASNHAFRRVFLRELEKHPETSLGQALARNKKKPALGARAFFLGVVILVVHGDARDI
jgi:hypothetical protein